MSKAVIEIKNISKLYKNSDNYAVKQLSLTINQKEIFGLLGPNGAGKTTLISMLCGLIKPTEGSLKINGLSFNKNSKEIKQVIGVVPQEYALYPTLTAYENLLYFGTMLGVNQKEIKDTVLKNLDHLGLLKFAHKKINTFSGGMKRRVNLIAGVLHNPKVLFLDEPTVGVDVQSKNAIIKHLQTLNSKGTTIIYTSHHLSEAENFCSNVAIIDNGSIIAKGSPIELIKTTKNALRLEDVFISLTGTELRDYA